MPQIATGGFRPHWSTHAGKSGFAHLGPFLNGGQSHLPRSSLQVPSPQPSPCQHGLGLAVPSVATLSAGSFLAAAVSNSGSFAARAGGGSSTGGSTTEVGATAVGASLAADAAVAAAVRSSLAARSSAAGAFSSCFSPSMRFFSSSWSWSMRFISAGSWKAFRVVVVVLGPLLEKRRSAKRAAAVPTSTLREPAAIATKVVGVLKTNDLEDIAGRDRPRSSTGRCGAAAGEPMRSGVKGNGRRGEAEAEQKVHTPLRRGYPGGGPGGRGGL